MVTSLRIRRKEAPLFLDGLDRDSFAGRVTLTYMDEKIELRAMFGFLDRDDLTQGNFIFA